MQQCCTENQFYVFLAPDPTGVLTAATAGPPLKQIYGKGVAHLWKNEGVAHLWKNEGVAPLRELLYSKIKFIMVYGGFLTLTHSHLYHY